MFMRFDTAFNQTRKLKKLQYMRKNQPLVRHLLF